jgi:hypothetical protein
MLRQTSAKPRRLSTLCLKLHPLDYRTAHSPSPPDRPYTTVRRSKSSSNRIITTRMNYNCRGNQTVAVYLEDSLSRAGYWVELPSPGTTPNRTHPTKKRGRLRRRVRPGQTLSNFGSRPNRNHPSQRSTARRYSEALCDRCPGLVPAVPFNVFSNVPDVNAPSVSPGNPPGPLLSKTNTFITPCVESGLRTDTAYSASHNKNGTIGGVNLTAHVIPGSFDH